MWQPINTAPKDGTRILLFDKGEKNVRDAMVVGYWCGCSGEWFVTGCEQNYECDNPGEWMPLPEAPKQEG